MNLAVIGSGGREHSICYKLKQSNKINKLICIPGNAGTQALAENINIDIKNFKEILKIIKIKNIDIVVIGPEEPLVNGIVDFLSKEGVKVLGPDKFGSKLGNVILEFPRRANAFSEPKKIILKSI